MSKVVLIIELRFEPWGSHPNASTKKELLFRELFFEELEELYYLSTELNENLIQI